MGIPAPTLVEETTPPPGAASEPKYVDTHPAALPDDLAAMIRKAADALAKDDRKSALGLLVNPAGLAGGTTVESVAEGMPKFNVLLLEGTLRQALKTPPRLTADGSFALFELSDASHARFVKADGVWRLSENRGPDADTPGVRYDDPAAHAAFLLKKLDGIEALDDEKHWSDAERPLVAALTKEGAGLARGKDAEGVPVTAAVFPEKFTGGDDGFARLKQIDGVRTIAVYVAPVSETALGELASLADVRRVRVLRPIVTDSTIGSLAKATKLRSLMIGATQNSPVHLAPLEALTSLERLELNGMAFDQGDLSHLKPMTQLKQLDLSFCTVDDKTLPPLHAMTHLDRLMIRGTQITADGVVALRAAVPNLFLDW
jgi:hypothetical protein